MSFWKASIQIIGVNPYVSVPDRILQDIMKASGKNKGPIPICGTLNGKSYTQTLVVFKSEWRLYINTQMLKNSPKRIGEVIEISAVYDEVSRKIEPPKAFVEALHQNKNATLVFESLSASRQLEITRYLARLKNPDILDKNIQRAIQFLLGKERFAGRHL